MLSKAKNIAALIVAFSLCNFCLAEEGGFGELPMYGLPVAPTVVPKPSPMSPAHRLMSGGEEFDHGQASRRTIFRRRGPSQSPAPDAEGSSRLYGFGGPLWKNPFDPFSDIPWAEATGEDDPDEDDTNPRLLGRLQMEEAALEAERQNSEAAPRQRDFDPGATIYGTSVAVDIPASEFERSTPRGPVPAPAGGWGSMQTDFERFYPKGPVQPVAPVAQNAPEATMAGVPVESAQGSWKGSYKGSFAGESTATDIKTIEDLGGIFGDYFHSSQVSSQSSQGSGLLGGDILETQATEPGQATGSVKKGFTPKLERVDTILGTPIDGVPYMHIPQDHIPTMPPVKPRLERSMSMSGAEESQRPRSLKRPVSAPFMRRR